jgi:hypothetical protein
VLHSAGKRSSAAVEGSRCDRKLLLLLDRLLEGLVPELEEASLLGLIQIRRFDVVARSAAAHPVHIDENGVAWVSVLLVGVFMGVLERGGWSQQQQLVEGEVFFFASLLTPHSRVQDLR